MPSALSSAARTGLSVEPALEGTRDPGRDVLRAGHCRRHEEHDDGVDLRIGEQHRQRRLVAGGGRRAEHVDRVREARLGRKQLGELAPSSPASGSESSSPAASQASEQRMPRPPAFVRSATWRPRGSGWVESSAAASISSSSVVARSTPAWWKSASTACSEPASAAVCEPAARAPARDVPLFMARIGFFRATRLAIRPKRRGLPNDSR